MKKNITIAPVEVDDINKIIEIQKMFLLSEDTSIKNGFLVCSFTENEYKRFLEDGYIMLKAKCNEEIIGAIIAFESNKISQDDVNNSLLKYSIKSDFILIKQIFIHPSFQRNGIASLLYEKIKELNKILVVVTVIDPFNLASFKFHKKNSFLEFLHFIPNADKDGKIRKRCAWIYSSSKSKKIEDELRLINTESHDNAEILKSRSTDLVNLYMHEDNLNWTKFERQIVILFGLMALLTYFFEKALSIKYIPYLSIIIFWGIIINTFFVIKIKSGITYMSTYKDKIKKFDTIMNFYYPQLEKIFTPSRIAQTSISVKLIFLFSILGLISWILASVYLLLKCYNINFFNFINHPL